MSMPDPLFKSDKEQIEQHIRKQFSRCITEYPGGMYEIRCIHPTKTWEDKNGNKKKSIKGEQFVISEEGFQQGIKYATDMNEAQGFNVYIGANPRKPGTFPGGPASANDVEIAFFCFADIDSEESVQILKAKRPLEYTYAVTTGRVPNPRPHIYWELEDPVMNMDAWKAQQGAIADHFKSDRVIDPPRIMRLAGTVNYPDSKKMERGYRTEVASIKVEYDDEERDPVTIEALAQCYPQKQRQLTEAPTEQADIVDAFLEDQYSDRINPEACIKNIQAGKEIHFNTRDLTAHMVGAGYPTWLIKQLTVAVLTPVSDGGTISQIDGMIDTARTKYNAPDTGIADAKTIQNKEVGTLKATVFGTVDPAKIPRREFLYGTHLIKKYVSATIAQGGGSKTTVLLTDAVALATGENLIGNAPKHECSVWHYNLEDPLDELQRRVVAICDKYDIELSDIKDSLFLDSARDRKLIVAEKVGNIVIATPDVDAIIAEIKANNIQCMSVDPFVKCHHVDENDNKQIDEVLNQWARIANETGCAIELAHHIRKPATGQNVVNGDINQARGASALSGAVRSARTISIMTDKEAEAVGLTPDKRNWYIRIDDAKGNMSAPASNAIWLQRQSVTLDNGDEFDPGDSVGVVAPWSPPDAFDGLSNDKIAEILNIIDKGPDEETQYSFATQAKRWVGKALLENTLQKTEPEVKQIIKAWKNSGLLHDDTYMNGKTRKDEKGVFVDWSKKPGQEFE